MASAALQAGQALCRGPALALTRPLVLRAGAATAAAAAASSPRKGGARPQRPARSAPTPRSPAPSDARHAADASAASNGVADDAQYAALVRALERARTRGGLDLAQLETVVGNIDRIASGGGVGGASPDAVAMARRLVAVGAAEALLTEALRHASDEAGGAQALTRLLRLLPSLHAACGRPRFTGSEEFTHSSIKYHERYGGGRAAAAAAARVSAQQALASPPATAPLDALPPLRPSQLLAAAAAPPLPLSATPPAERPARVASLFHDVLSAACAHPALLPAVEPGALAAAAALLVVGCDAPWHVHVLTLLRALLSDGAFAAGDEALLGWAPTATASAAAAHPALLVRLLEHYFQYGGDKLPDRPGNLAELALYVGRLFHPTAAAAAAGAAPAALAAAGVADGQLHLHAKGAMFASSVAKALHSRGLLLSAAPAGVANGPLAVAPGRLTPAQATQLLTAFALLPVRQSEREFALLSPGKTVPKAAAGDGDAPSSVPEAAALAALAQHLSASLSAAVGQVSSAGDGASSSTTLADWPPGTLVALLRTCNRLFDTRLTSTARRRLFSALTAEARAAASAPSSTAASADALPALALHTGRLLSGVFRHLASASSAAGGSGTPAAAARPHLTALPLPLLCDALCEGLRSAARTAHVPGDLPFTEACEAELLARPPAQWDGVPVPALVRLLEAYGALRPLRSRAYADVVCAVAVLALRRAGVPPYSGAPAATVDAAAATAGGTRAWFSPAAGWTAGDVAALARAALVLTHRLDGAYTAQPAGRDAVAEWLDQRRAAAPNAPPPAAALLLDDAAAGARLAGARAPRGLQAHFFLRDAVDAACTHLALSPSSGDAFALASTSRLLASWSTLASSSPTAPAPAAVAPAVVRSIAAQLLRVAGAPDTGSPRVTLPLLAPAAAVLSRWSATTDGASPFGPYSRRHTEAFTAAGDVPGDAAAAIELLRVPLRPLAQREPDALFKRVSPEAAAPATVTTVTPSAPSASNDVGATAAGTATLYIVPPAERAAVARFVCAVLDAAAAVHDSRADELRRAVTAATASPSNTAGDTSSALELVCWLNGCVAAVNALVAEAAAHVPPFLRPPAADNLAAAGVRGNSGGGGKGKPAPAAPQQHHHVCLDVDARSSERALLRYIVAAKAHNERLAADAHTEAAPAVTAANGGGSNAAPPHPLWQWELQLPSRGVAALVEAWADAQPSAAPLTVTAARAGDGVARPPERRISAAAVAGVRAPSVMELLRAQ